MRLIDADLLYRKLGWSDSDCELAEKLEKIPTIDAIEVVRCENCKYFVTNYAIPHCGRTLIGMKKSDYCSYGEKREDDETD